MKTRILLLASAVAVIAGCGHNDDDSPAAQNYRYTVSVQNLSANQPLSPLAVLAHNSSFSMFEVGQPASVELEHLAEGGSNAELLALSSSDDNIYTGTSGNGLIMPGTSDSITLTLSPDRAKYLSVASMFVNTNDAFVGETGLSIGSLATGETFVMNMNVWDSGTEANDELAATIPGPAGGGEGFNAARNDDDKVSFHSGVVSKDDGLATSALSANHRFLNPGARITIIRIE
ncbi:spondin domain-containing protein [Vibrio maritimus]|uniref:spondin domain-containing protein n=1 Tax=Vibrio maritimus TaxID=990268 RepID=UPI003736ECFF